MARQPTGNPTGRPQKLIDWTQFEQLCELQCTQSEIASFLKVHPETLSNRAAEHYGEDYSSVYKKYSESGKCSLRRAQFKLAMKNSSMAIWLGKLWLGQKDTSLEDKEELLQELVNAIRESEGKMGRKDDSSRTGKAERPALETQQPISYQGCAGEPYQISDELGAEGII